MRSETMILVVLISLILITLIPIGNLNLTNKGKEINFQILHFDSNNILYTLLVEVEGDLSNQSFAWSPERPAGEGGSILYDYGGKYDENRNITSFEITYMDEFKYNLGEFPQDWHYFGIYFALNANFPPDNAFIQTPYPSYHAQYIVRSVETSKLPEPQYSMSKNGNVYLLSLQIYHDHEFYFFIDLINYLLFFTFIIVALLTLFLILNNIKLFRGQKPYRGAWMTMFYGALGTIIVFLPILLIEIHNLQAPLQVTHMNRIIISLSIFTFILLIFQIIIEIIYFQVKKDTYSRLSSKQCSKIHR